MRLTEFITRDAEFASALEAARAAIKTPKPLPIAVNGLSGGAEEAFLCELLLGIRDVRRGVTLVIESSEDRAVRAAARLSSLGVTTRTYKPRTLTFHNISASHDIERERLSVLLSVLTGECEAVVTTASAALSYTLPKDYLAARSQSIRVGDELSLKTLSEKLTLLGFKRVDAVESAGQFAVRGGIADFWINADESPIRVEFFGDEIDRMSYFDPISQRSEGAAEAVTLLPAAEIVLDDGARARVTEYIEKMLKRAEGESAERLAAELDLIRAGIMLEGRDKYLPVVYPERHCLFDYAEGGAVVILGTSGAKEELKLFTDSLRSDLASLTDTKRCDFAYTDFIGSKEALDEVLLGRATIHINSFSGGVTSGALAGLFGLRCRKTVSYGLNPAMLTDDLEAYRRTLYRTVVFAEGRSGAQSLSEVLTDKGIPHIPAYQKESFDFSKMRPGEVAIAVGSVGGYELITPKIAILSMAKDDGRATVAHRRRQRALKRAGAASEQLMSYAELSVGDYVVHANYGIGLFEGMQTITVDGITKDYITIRYAGTDKLLVPCDRLEYIGKYIGERANDGTVKLSKMGGGEWHRAKSRAKSAVKDIAKKLIALYAERQRLPGFAHSSDCELEEEFASSFEYEETASQALAIKEIKADMMKPVPMNRLLCGDVGFGKTEVALRAAFKALMSGKQVAILVPTTILALQHYQTTLSRMRSYPVTVDMLSRFRTKKEEAAILRRVERGETDILIGTHKLLGSSIKFRDLGLLIIDEEQRFGVSQKEKLKEMSRNVDVLTLSATPIPRTLNMAMSGISDMSILDEAPGDRLPVQTYVLEYDEVVILDAIRRELSRGGQTIYLYNRVDDIHVVAGKIAKAFSDARVAFAHGQMERDELEDIWQMLVHGEIDILVCTTIVETGVDLPNANTLIIENADRMGLSQLHQIRGRVGRSERQAYAYFTYRRGKALSEIAERRLRAIREYAEFGAGFKIALEDLEIRGAGNLLGSEQHGYIESVGYDLYVRLLNEAVLEESGRGAVAPFESTVEYRATAHIPESYIRSEAQRMQMYRKVSLIQTKEDKSDIEDEFIDRFGDMPRSVERLLSVSLIRALASRCRVGRVEFSEGFISFSIELDAIGTWSVLFDERKNLMLRQQKTPIVIARLSRGTEPLGEAIDILSRLLKAKQDEENEENEENEK